MMRFATIVGVCLWFVSFQGVVSAQQILVDHAHTFKDKALNPDNPGADYDPCFNNKVVLPRGPFILEETWTMKPKRLNGYLGGDAPPFFYRDGPGASGTYIEGFKGLLSETYWNGVLCRPDKSNCQGSPIDRVTITVHTWARMEAGFPGGAYRFEQCPAEWGGKRQPAMTSHWTVVLHPDGTVPQSRNPQGAPGDGPAPPPPPTEIGQTPSACTLALNRPARQSSTGYGGAAQRAVDGNTSGVYSKNSVTHTNNEPEAWWEVDLGLLSQINFVYLWNRTDCCADRLSNFYLLVSKKPFPEDNLETLLKDQSIWRVRYDGQAPEKRLLDVNFQGRYVRIQLIGTNYLSLAEVQVCGSAFTSETPQEESEGTRKPSEQELTSGIVGTKGHCEPAWGYFTVPGGQKASGFRYSGLESGFNCETGAKIERRGFTIHKDDAMWTRVYSYSVNEKGQSFETGGPLNLLVITPGSYFVSVDGGYDAEVKVFFNLR